MLHVCDSFPILFECLKLMLQCLSLMCLCVCVCVCVCYSQARKITSRNRSVIKIKSFLYSLELQELSNGHPLLPIKLILYTSRARARGGVVVKALSYKPVGRGFDSRWCHWNFSVT